MIAVGTLVWILHWRRAAPTRKVNLSHPVLIDCTNCPTRGSCNSLDLLASESDKVGYFQCVCDRLEVVFKVVHTSFCFALAAFQKHLTVDFGDEEELPNKLVCSEGGVREESAEEIIKPYLCVTQQCSRRLARDQKWRGEIEL